MFDCSCAHQFSFGSSKEQLTSESTAHRVHPKSLPPTQPNSFHVLENFVYITMYYSNVMSIKCTKMYNGFGNSIMLVNLGKLSDLTRVILFKSQWKRKGIDERTHLHWSN